MINMFRKKKKKSKKKEELRNLNLRFSLFLAKTRSLFLFKLFSWTRKSDER